MFFTRDGLEQATRPAVADHHAQRFLAAGVRRVVDLGCGIGADALAFARAGLEVVAVERDPDTAAVAMANLAGRAEVLCADAEEVAVDAAHAGGRGVLRPGPAERARPGLAGHRLHPELVARHPPARRTAYGRGQARPGAAARPGSRDAEAEWLTDHGDTVEVGLWAGRGRRRGVRSALVRAGDGWHRLVTDRDPRADGPRGRRLPVRAGRRGHPLGRHRRAGPAAGGRAARSAPRVPDRRPRGGHPVRHRVRRAGAAALRRAGAAPLGGRAAGRSPGDQAARHHRRPGEAAPGAAADRPECGHADRLPDPRGSVVLVAERVDG